MMELLSIEKLKEYGFSDLMIERLADARNEFECKVATDRGFFYASNKTGFVYSGEMGYDKFHGIGIDRFKTFESMFDRAVAMQSVELNIDPKLPEGHKTAIYKVSMSLYNFEFNDWIQRFKAWEYGDAEQYRSLLTKEVWLEFMAYKLDKEDRDRKRYEADKETWKVAQIIDKPYKALKPMMQIQKMFESQSYKLWEADQKACLEGWQYWEPSSLEYSDRYSLDIEAYVKTFFDPAHSHEAKFSEKALLQRLIQNLKPAKHPYVIGYREFLENELLELSKVDEPFVSELITITMQRIIYPNDLERADSDAAIMRERFDKDVNAGDPERIYKYLIGLPDLLKGWLSQATAENPERCKRGLIQIRYEALLWYQLSNIEDSRCNIKLYELKNELKYYIVETEKIYKALPVIGRLPIAPDEVKVEKPRRDNIKERLFKYGLQSFLANQRKMTAERITKVEEALLREELPYCIALLNGVEYLDYIKKEYCNGKAVERDKLLAEIFDAPARRIKGNINVLNPKSNEDRSNYTSHQYKEIIDKLLKGR